MSDNKRSSAIGLGLFIGTVAVVTIAALYVRKHREQKPRDVNKIFESARQTIQHLNEALENLRSAAGAT